MTTPDPLAVAAMIGRCRWDPTEVVTDREVKLDGNGTKLLTLPSLYVTDVASVSVTDWRGTTTTASVGPGNDVGWSENGCLVWNAAGVWPEGQRNVTVVFSGGYDEIPVDLAAALDSVGKRVGRFGATQRRMGTASVSFGKAVSDGDLLVVELMVFDRYRLPGAS